jgi:hypothetical protein
MSTRTTILVFASAILVTGFALWRTTSTSVPVSEARLTDTPAAESGARTSDPELSAADSVASLKTAAALSDRAAESSRARDPLESGGGPPPLTDLSSTPSVEAAQLDPIPSADREFFAAKYAKSRADERRRARGTLEALFNAHKSGEESKSNALTEEEAAAIEREMMWLVENPGD